MLLVGLKILVCHVLPSDKSSGSAKTPPNLQQHMPVAFPRHLPFTRMHKQRCITAPTVEAPLLSTSVGAFRCVEPRYKPCVPRDETRSGRFSHKGPYQPPLWSGISILVRSPGRLAEMFLLRFSNLLCTYATSPLRLSYQC